MHFNNDTDLYRTIGSNIKHYRQQANCFGVGANTNKKWTPFQTNNIPRYGITKCWIYH